MAGVVDRGNGGAPTHGETRAGDIERWPSVSVVVVGYNSRAHLDTCLTAVERQRYPGAIEVLFVDNGSRDGSAAHVARGFPRVRTIATSANGGYAGGNNAGARAATGDVLVFLNPDTEAAPEAIYELVRPMRDDPTIGMTTAALVLFERRDRLNTAGNTIHLSGLTVCRLAGRPVADARDADVAAVSGACCAIRRVLFTRLGSFDEAFFMYLEDTDLSWRARLAGYRCRLAAAAIVAHRYRLGLGAEKTFWLERNRHRLLMKHLSPRAGLALLPLLVATEALTLGWAVLQGPRHVRAKLRAYAWTLRNLRSLIAAREGVQRIRRRPDREILVQHTIQAPIADAAEGVAARASARLTGPLFRACGRFALRATGAGRG